jgi:hypothetical protein
LTLRQLADGLRRRRSLSGGLVLFRRIGGLMLIPIPFCRRRTEKISPSLKLFFGKKVFRGIGIFFTARTFGCASSGYLTAAFFANHRGLLFKEMSFIFSASNYIHKFVLVNPLIIML